MQLGGIKPIRPEDWQMPSREGIGATAPSEPIKDEAAAQLQQIKWLMVALLIIILIKK